MTEQPYPDDPVLRDVAYESDYWRDVRFVQKVDRALRAGRSRRRIAEALGIAPSNLTQRLRRTRDRIQERTPT